MKMEDDSLLDTPCRKKLKTTKSIYQSLFLNGENSDIRICALGQEWNLHKDYLCQSGYFSSMFSGSCKQSNMRVIQLEIPDQNIDIEALQVVFGSLYCEDFLINSSRVVSILAAACMFQMDELSQQCGETMKENISVKSVCGFYATAKLYGLDSVMKKCLEWLLHNLMTHQNVELMKELGVEIMEQLIQSSDLIVMQMEMDVYNTLKQWMFLQLNPSWDGPIKELLLDADTWLCKRRSELGEDEPFLSTEQGSPFTPAFRHIRLQYIINDLTSARILESDNIIPPDWLNRTYKQQWFTELRTSQYNDIRPQETNKEEFEKNSMRCGRMLNTDRDDQWIWKGYNCSFDLLVTYTNGSIVFKQKFNQPYKGLARPKPQRHFTFRLWLASLDSCGKLIYSHSTGKQLLTMVYDQEHVVMNLDSRLLSFPLYVCCNFLYIFTDPEDQQIGKPPLRQRMKFYPMSCLCVCPPRT